MNTTTLTRIAPRLATVALGLAVVAMATVVLSTSAVAEFTIYSDDFSGDGSPLEGTTPDVAPIFVEWYAGETTFFANGTVEAIYESEDARGGGGAYLPFEPEAGRIYTASADINNLTLGWVGFGFVQNPYNDYIDDDSGRHEQGALGSQWFQVYSGSAKIVDSATSDAVGGEQFILDTIGGLTGTNSFEIVFDATDENAVQVSFSINDTEEFTYNAGPLATIGYENSGGFPGVGQVDYGIRGLGFSASGCCSNPETILDGIDNFLLTVDVGPPTLGIRVNTVTGAITMLGPETGTVDLSYYDITSAGNSLDEAGWNSLAAQDYDGNGPPDDSGNGWEEGGSNGAHGLAEGYLLGSSTFGVGASVSLGNGYDVNVDAQDLFFTYSPGDGPVSRGLVQYVDVPGDFDADGDVDGADFLLWQRNPGVGALGDWQDNFGTVDPPLAAAAGAVPEPASLALLGLGGLMLLYRRRA